LRAGAIVRPVAGRKPRVYYRAKETTMVIIVCSY
jgi:hypothetical protein